MTVSWRGRNGMANAGGMGSRMFVEGGGNLYSRQHLTSVFASFAHMARL